MNNFLHTAVAVVLLATAPVAANAATTKKAKHHKKHKVQHVVHHVASSTMESSNTNSTYVAPATNPSIQTTSSDGTTQSIPAKVVSKTRQAGHKISYNTWKLTHPNQARAEYDAEQAADAQREAADRAHEAEYHATHP